MFIFFIIIVFYLYMLILETNMKSETVSSYWCFKHETN